MSNSPSRVPDGREIERMEIERHLKRHCQYGMAPGVPCTCGLLSAAASVRPDFEGIARELYEALKAIAGHDGRQLDGWVQSNADWGKVDDAVDALSAFERASEEAEPS